MAYHSLIRQIRWLLSYLPFEMTLFKKEKMTCRRKKTSCNIYDAVIFKNALHLGILFFSKFLFKSHLILMKSIKDSFSVLIPDGEHYYAITIIDCLSHVKGIKIHFMSDIKYTAMRYSRHVHTFSYYPKTNNDLEWISFVNRETEKHKVDVILPVYENRIRTLLYHKEQLTFTNKLVLLPSTESYEIASNKWLLAKHMEEFDINSPKGFLVTPDEHGWIENMNLTFPIIGRPTKDTAGGDGIFKIEDIDELQGHINNNSMKGNILIQEYIHGHDMGCNVLCKEGEILAFTIQKGTMWDKKPFSPQIGLDMVFEEELLAIIKKLMKSLQWSGVANVDLRYDAKNNTYSVLEINPRYWATLHASLIAGINFPYLLCLTTKGIKYDIPDYENIEYLNLKGLFQRIGENKSFIFRWKFIWKNTPLKYVVKDPLVNIYKFIWRTKNIVMRKFKKNQVS
jgi:predicted ATP-grasp superfamily ATP-dependent carboligase